MPNNRLQEFLSRRFRKFLSGDPQGIPPWLEVVASGDKPGLYLPTDAPWVVHADFGTLVGGIRALLMQALHPGSLTGVKNHSRYEQDPLGRLSGTIRWLTVTTFGSTDAVAQEAGRVNRMHERVQGNYQTAAGESIPYRAADPDLLLWVHIAFMDSFLRAHQYYSKKPIPGGADSYVALWSKSVEPLGLKNVPMNETELLQTIADFKSKLVVNEQTRSVLKWLKRPPLPILSRPFYALFFQAALASIPKDFRSMIGYRALPTWFLKPITSYTLILMRLAIGPDSPIEDAARERLQRAGVYRAS